MAPSSARARALLAVGVLAAAAALLAMASGDLATGALRATAVLGLLAAAGFAVRRGRGDGGAAATRAVTIQERHPLGKETGLAVIALADRRLLLGFGPSGVTAIAELTAAPAEDRP
jgi:flagellar biogenesis protein FliO